MPIYLEEQRPCSPSSIASHDRPQAQKRKRSLSEDPCVVQPPPKKHQQQPLLLPSTAQVPERGQSGSQGPCLTTSSQRPQAGAEERTELPRSPVAYWVATRHWPEVFQDADVNMNTPSKRKSSTTHVSEQLERLQANRVYMKSSTGLQKSSKDLCRSFLQGDLIPGQLPCYPLEQLPNVLERIAGLNEDRLQRDITPWVVPSAENLHFSGRIELDYLGEELNAVCRSPSHACNMLTERRYGRGVRH